MKSQKNKRSAPDNANQGTSKSLIKAKHLDAYLRSPSTKARGIRAQDLAKLINVNPVSLSRWLKTDKADPTSTSLLVLIPLLLAAGVDFLPAADETALNAQVAFLRQLGVLKEDELKDPAKRDRLRKAVGILQSPHVQASRRLFAELQTAWAAIDNATFMELPPQQQP
jgi:transcriptional regulator with XRE-family HTH domain